MMEMNAQTALPNWPPAGDRARTLREWYFLFQPRYHTRRRGGQTAKKAAITEWRLEAKASRPAKTVESLLESKKDRAQKNERHETAPMKTGKKLPATVPAGPVKPSPVNPPPKQPDNTRETIESIVVAFVLAFLFRTFEAEAFVIPTGSMPPTLYGQQRDVHCQQCGTRFAVGA